MAVVRRGRAVEITAVFREIRRIGKAKTLVACASASGVSRLVKGGLAVWCSSLTDGNRLHAKHLSMSAEST